jgi:UDP-2-acetamido-3-amino-2,3-dideoxy-glucuronate N-acetyltransferase
MFNPHCQYRKSGHSLSMLQISLIPCSFVPQLFQNLMYPDVFIHPTAVVDAGAQIDAGTKVWHFTHLMPRCIVGADCIIGQNVFIDNDVVIGAGVKIQNNVSVYNGVLLEDGVFVGPSVVFTNVINPRSFVERKQEFKRTVIHTGASIGANATIVCGIEVGAYAMVGAGAVVTRSVLPFALVYGNPARQYGWISRNGHPLLFDGQGEAFCEPEGKTYKLEEGYVRDAS